MKPEEVATANLQERLALARSPDTADEILMLLAQDRGLDVRRALTERKGLSDQLMQQLVNDKSKDIRLRMAKHTELTARYMEILAGSREAIIQAAIASREDASENILLKLAASNKRDVGLAILKRTKLSDELLLKLAANNNRDVGLAILERSTLSDELLDQLKCHRIKNVRIALATRTTIPDVLISTLMEDKSTDVAVAVSGREKLSIEHTEKLFYHKSGYVRAAIASRNDLPKEMLEKFALDDSAVVLQAVANRDALPDYLTNKMLAHANSNTRDGLARREPLPREIVDTLALDEDDRVRARVAARSDITESMIETFAADSSTRVRLAVVCRRDLSEQVLQQLSSQLTIDNIGCIDDMSDLLRYIENVSKAHLVITNHKLAFGDDWNEGGWIDYKRLGQLLALLFLHPASKTIEEIEITIDWSDFGFEKTLGALSDVQTETEVKRISLSLDGVDTSSASCNNLGVIDKRVFPKLEYLSTEGGLGGFELDLPELKVIIINSSGDEFHELLLMLLGSNLPNLESLFISAGNYHNGGDQNKQMKLYLEDAHEIWPNLKSLTIGARYAYDWDLLFTSPLFRQLDRLDIDLDDPHAYGYYECSDDYDEKTKECIMYRSLIGLIDALINRSEYLSNIGSISVGIGNDFVNGECDLQIDEEKIVRLKKLYDDFSIEYSVYVGGYE